MAASKVRIVFADGVAPLVKAALIGNGGGLRDTLAGLVGNARDVSQNPDGSWPTITRHDWLSYRWVARYDAKRMPTAAVGALPGDQYVGLADGFIPGESTTIPETRTAAVAEDFAGALDGAAWPAARWTPGKVAPTGSVTVKGQTGVLTSGATGGYEAEDMAGVRVAGQPIGDVELLFDVKFGTAVESEVRVVTKSKPADLLSSDGVSFTISRQWVGASVATAWAHERVGTEVPAQYAAGVWYRCRVITASQTGGSTLLRIRVWRATDPEPETWLFDQTTSKTLPATGYVGLIAPSGDAPVANVITLDNIAVYTRPPTATPQWWGTWAG